MPDIQKYSLGQPVPSSPHAVVSNIPTMEDVCAYEEKDPRVVQAMQQGYPRFVRHHWVQALTKAVLESLKLECVFAVLVYRSQDLLEALHTLDPNIQSKAIASDLFGTEVYLLFVDVNCVDSIKQLKAFVQHSGIEISSRNAEAGLKWMGLLSGGQGVGEGKGDSKSTIEIEALRQEVALGIHRELGTHVPGDVRLTASGMNAFYSGFRAIQTIQAPKGRNQWIQVGWLYVDSGSILNKYLTDEESLELVYDPSDTEAIIRKIKLAGEALSALVIECPTNPFCQIADLKRIAEAVWSVGGLMLVDPSVASIYNIDCLPYADVLVCSLTKYAGYTGDVLAGLVALNAEGKAYDLLSDSVERLYAPLYNLDVRRLSEVFKHAGSRVAEMNANCQHLARFLKAQPKVKKIYSVSENNMDVGRDYLKSEDALGSIISIELQDSCSVEAFYNRLQVVKGPSFGAEFTIVCPYFYLAHYTLVLDKSPSGVLNQLGIDRNLIRISVGCEPVDALIQAFSEALQLA